MKEPQVYFYFYFALLQWEVTYKFLIKKHCRKPDLSPFKKKTHLPLLKIYIHLTKETENNSRSTQCYAIVLQLWYFLSHRFIQQ